MADAIPPKTSATEKDAKNPRSAWSSVAPTTQPRVVPSNGADTQEKRAKEVENAQRSAIAVLQKNQPLFGRGARPITQRTSTSSSVSAKSPVRVAPFSGKGASVGTSDTNTAIGNVVAWPKSSSTHTAITNVAPGPRPSSTRTALQCVLTGPKSSNTRTAILNRPAPAAPRPVTSGTALRGAAAARSSNTNSASVPVRASNPSAPRGAVVASIRAAPAAGAVRPSLAGRPRKSVCPEGGCKESHKATTTYNLDVRSPRKAPAPVKVAPLKPRQQYVTTVASRDMMTDDTVETEQLTFLRDNSGHLRETMLPRTPPKVATIADAVGAVPSRKRSKVPSISPMKNVFAAASPTAESGAPKPVVQPKPVTVTSIVPGAAGETIVTAVDTNSKLKIELCLSFHVRDADGKLSPLTTNGVAMNGVPVNQST